ncbi:MAG: hypothetical protein AAB539_03165 [Patescibacteria group bacterium]
MPRFPQEQLEERYEILPESLKDALFSPDIARAMVEIGKKYGLNIEATGLMAEETGYVVLGLTHPEDFVRVLAKATGLHHGAAGEMASDINRRVFFPLRETLKAAHDKEYSEEVIRNGGDATEAPLYARQAPPPPVQTGIGPADVSPFEKGGQGGISPQIPPPPSSQGGYGRASNPPLPKGGVMPPPTAPATPTLPVKPGPAPLIVPPRPVASPKIPPEPPVQRNLSHFEKGGQGGISPQIPPDLPLLKGGVTPPPPRPPQTPAVTKWQEERGRPVVDPYREQVEDIAEEIFEDEDSASVGQKETGRVTDKTLPPTRAVDAEWPRQGAGDPTGPDTARPAPKRGRSNADIGARDAGSLPKKEPEAAPSRNAAAIVAELAKARDRMQKAADAPPKIPPIDLREIKPRPPAGEQRPDRPAAPPSPLEPQRSIPGSGDPYREPIE